MNSSRRCLSGRVGSAGRTALQSSQVNFAGRFKVAASRSLTRAGWFSASVNTAAESGDRRMVCRSASKLSAAWLGGLQHERRYAQVRLGGSLLQPPLGGCVDAQLQAVIFHRSHVLTMAVHELLVKRRVIGTGAWHVGGHFGTTRHARW